MFYNCLMYIKYPEDDSDSDENVFSSDQVVTHFIDEKGRNVTRLVVTTISETPEDLNDVEIAQEVNEAKQLNNINTRDVSLRVYEMKPNDTNEPSNERWKDVFRVTESQEDSRVKVQEKREEMLLKALGAGEVIENEVASQPRSHPPMHQINEAEANFHGRSKVSLENKMNFNSGDGISGNNVQEHTKVTYQLTPQPRNPYDRFRNYRNRMRQRGYGRLHGGVSLNALSSPHRLNPLALYPTLYRFRGYRMGRPGPKAVPIQRPMAPHASAVVPVRQVQPLPQRQTGYNRQVLTGI